METGAVTHGFDGTRREVALRDLCSRIATGAHVTQDFDRVARAGRSEPRALKVAINSLDLETVTKLASTVQRAMAAEGRGTGAPPEGPATDAFAALREHTYANIGLVHGREGTRVVAAHRNDVVELESGLRGRTALHDAVRRYGLGPDAETRVVLVGREFDKHQAALRGVVVPAVGLKPVTIVGDLVLGHAEPVIGRAARAAMDVDGRSVSSDHEVRTHLTSGPRGAQAKTRIAVPSAPGAGSVASPRTAPVSGVVSGNGPGL